MLAKFISNLSIKRKLLLLSVFVTLGFVGIGSIYGYAIKLEKNAANADKRINSIRLTVEEISTGILQARRNEKDFLLRNDTKYLTKHKKTMEGNYALISRLEHFADDNEDIRAAKQIKQDFIDYEKSFTRMSELKIELGLDENSGLIGNLRQAVHNVEDDLKKYNQLSLSHSMLMMRRHEKDYIARMKNKYIEKMAKQKLRFEELLTSSPLSDSNKKSIRNNMSEYHKHFLSMTEGSSKVVDEIAIFRESAHAIDPLLEQLVNQAQQNYESNKTQQIENRRWITNMMYIILTLVAVVVLFVIWLFSRNIVRGLSQAVAHASKLAKHDLSGQVEVHASDEVGLMLGNMNKVTSNLSTVVAEVRERASSVASAASEIAAGNSNLSGRTEEQASSLEETASSIEEMTSTVKQNADNATLANQLSDDVRNQAEQGGLIVSKAIDAMSQIDQASNKIADIINVINELAFQTNLLALNAAVEAARAGDQGRGFAVVAAEVRNLAQRSATAAKEIGDLIQDSVDKVKIGSDQVNQSGETLNKIVNGVTEVSNALSDIATASHQQYTGIEQINSAVEQMEQMTQQNAALVEEAAANSKSLEQQSSILTNLMSTFKLSGAAENKLLRQNSASKPHEITFRKNAGQSQTVAMEFENNKIPGSRKKPLQNITATKDSDWAEF